MESLWIKYKQKTNYPKIIEKIIDQQVQRILTILFAPFLDDFIQVKGG